MKYISGWNVLFQNSDISKIWCSRIYFAQKFKCNYHKKERATNEHIFVEKSLIHRLAKCVCQRKMHSTIENKIILFIKRNLQRAALADSSGSVRRQLFLVLFHFIQRNWRGYLFFSKHFLSQRMKLVEIILATKILFPTFVCAVCTIKFAYFTVTHWMCTYFSLLFCVMQILY